MKPAVVLPTLFVAVCCLSCAEADLEVEAQADVAAPIPDVPAVDLVGTEDGKADGTTFNADDLIDDSVFTDAAFLDVDAVQTFLEGTPYGTRSFLADYVRDGESAAEAIIDAAQTHQINPLVLLTKLQVEAGLISKMTVPPQRLLDQAMGCACPDNRPCSRAEAGFANQIDCAAQLLREYIDDIAQTGRTWTGWGIGVTKTTLDPERVTPENAATAALYTYTPWVLRNRGGNWLFWNIYRKYSRYMLSSRPNYRWVGGECADDASCPFDGGSCLTSFPGGLCTTSCWQFCPDSGNPYTSMTFCTDLGTELTGVADGRCVPRCDERLFPATDGCREGYSCQTATRHGDPTVEQEVCLPTD